MQRRWLEWLIVGILAYALVPFLAPVLMWLGFTQAAQVIYVPYKFTCHTYGFRSFYLFGEAFAYDRQTFEQISGLNTRTVSGLLAARDFQGNARTGYKVALCQRDVAIYLAMGLNGLIYLRVRHRARPIPWWLFIVVGLLPIALDGVSQLLSQPPFNVLPFRESTWALRLLTGGLLGTTLAWLVFPLLDGLMRE